MWNYYREEIDDHENENHNDNRLNNNKTITSKKKTRGSTLDNESRLNAEVVVPLKYLSNFWRCPDLPLNNCEIELD